jgi:Tol biopolymer transport system component
VARSSCRTKLRRLLILSTVGAVGASGLVTSPPAGAGVVVTATRPVMAPGPAEPNGEIVNASTNPSRTCMVFQSDASNLVADDDNGVTDVFVRDLVAGTTSLVSKVPGGGESDADSYSPSISDDCKKVVFTTDSDLFDEENDFNFEPDVYLVDRDADNNDVLDEWTSPDAVRIARMSVGTDLLEADFGGWDGVISGNGQWVTYVTGDDIEANDQNGDSDVYVRSTDPELDVNERVSFRTNPALGGGVLPSISQTGRYIAFATSATDLVSGGTVGGVVLRDRDTDDDSVFDESDAVANEYVSKAGGGATNGASGAPDFSRRPSITPDGRCVAFKFVNGFGLDAGATGNAVFLRNRDADTTKQVSRNNAGLAAVETANAAVSPNCRYVSFDSSDSALVTPDANASTRDVFVRDTKTNKLELISRVSSTPGASAAGPSASEQVFSDAKAVITSSAPNIGGVAGGTGARDPFVVSFTIDFKAPVAAMQKPGTIATRWNLGLSVPTQWSATDTGGAGVKSYTVQRKQASFNGSMGAYGAFQTKVTKTKATYAAPKTARGSTQCFHTRAADKAGNVGAYTTDRCTAIPLVASQLAYTGSWKNVTNASAYGGTYRQATATNASFTKTGVKAKRLALVVGTCSTCGTVKVYWNNVLKATVALTSATTKYKQIKAEVLLSSSSVQTGTVKVVVSSSGKPVRIEGLAVSKSAT